MTRPIYDCAIIGAGPAGLTAAVYLRRFLRDIILIHHGRPRAKWIPRCHNLIGFDQGITGPELLDHLWKQVRDLETESLEASAKVRLDEGIFQISAGEHLFRAKKVILATGIRDRQPEWTNIFELRQAGLLRYCPVCDSYEHRNQPLAVVADDAHGVREALFLSRFSDELLLLAPADLKIPAALQEKLDAKGIEVTRDFAERAEIVSEGDQQKIELHFTGRPPRRFRAVYVALGIEVNQDAFAELGPLEKTEDGFLKTGPRQELAVPGAFAIGDCVEGLSQISVAAGQAAIAAMAVHNQLRETENEVPPPRAPLSTFLPSS